jgi:hypothetical protein
MKLLRQVAGDIPDIVSDESAEIVLEGRLARSYQGISSSTDPHHEAITLGVGLFTAILDLAVKGTLDDVIVPTSPMARDLRASRDQRPAVGERVSIHATELAEAGEISMPAGRDGAREAKVVTEYLEQVAAFARNLPVTGGRAL